VKPQVSQATPPAATVRLVNSATRRDLPTPGGHHEPHRPGCGRGPPGRQQPSQLVFTAERRRPRKPGWPRVDRGVPGGDDGPDGNRCGLPRDGDVTGLFQDHRVLGCDGGVGPDQDRSGVCLGLQPSRDVGDVTGQPPATAAGVIARVDQNLSGVHTDPHAQIVLVEVE